MTKKLDFDGNGLSNLPSIAVTIVVVVAIIDITASRYRRAARGGRCAARTGARSGGRLPGTARGVIPHSSIVAHPVKTAFLGVRIGVRPQRRSPPIWHRSCHCPVTLDIAALATMVPTAWDHCLPCPAS